MKTLFELISTYEMLLEFQGALKPIRIEIFRDAEIKSLFRARVWEQNTYNLYPTMENIRPDGGINNTLASCDEVNREITSFLAEDPTLVTGKEYSSESDFRKHLQSLVTVYHESLTA